MNKNISVLLMDDEPSSEIIQVTADWLRQDGFSVDTAETMTQAIESYYEKLYDVFVLDIDMSHIPDEQEGDGVIVLKRFISLHNQTKVIMFSGAGTVPHWFEAANAHCYAYVHKNEKNSVRKLSEFISKSAEEAEIPDPKYAGEECPRSILVCCKDSRYTGKIRESAENALGTGWAVNLTDSLDDAYRNLSSEPYGIAVIFQEIFELYKDEKALLESVLSMSPKPQVIVGCLGRDDLQHSVLFIANNHPFRMINLAEKGWQGRFEDALEKAGIWHGQREIFQADPDALRRMHITLPPDVLSEWEDYIPEEMDAFYEDLQDETEEGGA